MRIEPDNWYYCPEHGELCRIIETQTLWGETVCRVWLPSKDTVVRLRPVHEVSVGILDWIAYLAAYVFIQVRSFRTN